MSDFGNALQLAVYTQLLAEIDDIPIYDSIPFQPDGNSTANFPCIAIGDDTLTPWDTDEMLGMSATVTLHVWSRKLGKKEVKEILGRIYAALNRQAAALSAVGFRFVDCLFEFSEIIEDIDGKTRHGICRYRIIMEKV